MPKENLQYFGDDGDRMQMMFNFHVNQSLFYALASADTQPLAKALGETRKKPHMGQWGYSCAIMMSLILGASAKTSASRSFRAFGPEKSMQLYDRGIRRRLAPMLGGDERRLKLAYSLMYSLPGTPVLRYGDEIGMGDDLSLPERNCARTPCSGRTSHKAGLRRETSLSCR